MAELRYDSAGNVIADPNPWLSPGGIQSLLTSLGLVVGKDGTVSQTGTGTTKEVGTTTKTETSPEAMGFLNQILPSLISSTQSGDYSKAAAIKDSQGIVNQVMQNYKEMVLPQIFAGEASRGGYASTSKALLSNDAASRAAAQAASLVADTAIKYGGIQSQNTNALTNILNTMVNANKQSTTSTALDKSVLDSLNKTTNESGLGSNSLLQSLGGAGALYSVLAKFVKPEDLKNMWNSLFGPGAPVGSTGVNASADIAQSIADLGGSSGTLSVDDLLGLGGAGADLPY